MENTREKATEEFYDLSKTWFEPVPDPSATDNEAVVTVQPAGTEPVTNISPAVDQAAVTPRSSGDGRPRPRVPVVTQDDGGDVPSPPAFASEGDASDFQTAASEGGAPASFDTAASERDPNDSFMPNILIWKSLGSDGPLV